MYCLTVSEARSPRLKCQQSWLLLKVAREHLLLASLLALGAGGILCVPWLLLPSAFTLMWTLTRVWLRL